MDHPAALGNRFDPLRNKQMFPQYHMGYIRSGL